MIDPTMTLLGWGIGARSAGTHEEAQPDLEYLFHFTIRGTYSLVVEGEAKQQPKGTASCVAGRAFQRYLFDKDALIFWIHFVPESLWVRYMLELGKAWAEWPDAATSPWQGIVDRIVSLYQGKENQPWPISEDEYEYDLVLFIQGMLTSCVAEMLTPADDSNSGEMRRGLLLKPALDFMNSEYKRPIPLAEIARQVHLGPRHFQRKFAATFGLSPNTYLIQKRLRVAQEMLAMTNRSVKEIAAAVGYENPYYFSRLFRARFAISPTQWRRKRKLRHQLAS